MEIMQKLLFTDTDSFVFENNIKHFNQEINHEIEKLFNTSDYPTNHKIGIKRGLNSKVFGMFNNEAGGKQIV